MGKWAIPQPTLPPKATTTSSPPSLPYSLPVRPQQTSKAPSSSSLKKWIRAEPPTTPTHYKRSGSRPSNSSNSTQPSDHRLQRDLAPHQDPLVGSNINSPNTPRQPDKHTPHHGRGSRVTHQRPTLIEQTFGSRPPPDPRTASRSAPPRATQESQDPSNRNTPAITAVDIAARNARNGRPNRIVQRERGSLLTREEDNVTFSHRAKGVAKPQSSTPTKAKKKAFVEKRVSADVYMPTTVSVGTLARLLGVRLGGCFQFSASVQKILIHGRTLATKDETGRNGGRS
jgi:translation initiation factor IF-2